MTLFHKPFDQLTLHDLHRIYTLRTAVFVVEQACPYQEVDDFDLLADHLWLENDGELVAYCRLIPQEHEVKLGRVVVEKSYRGQGLARDLVSRAIAIADQKWPEKTIFLQAQAHLVAFYTHFGFKAISDTYLEDGIPHIDMQLDKETT